MKKIKIKFFVFLTLKRIFKLDRFLFFLFLPIGFFRYNLLNNNVCNSYILLPPLFSSFFLPMDGFNCGPKGLSFFSVPSNFFCFVLFRIFILPSDSDFDFLFDLKSREKKHFLFQCFFFIYFISAVYTTYYLSIDKIASS